MVRNALSALRAAHCFHRYGASPIVVIFLRVALCLQSGIRAYLAAPMSTSSRAQRRRSSPEPWYNAGTARARPASKRGAATPGAGGSNGKVAIGGGSVLREELPAVVLLVTLYMLQGVPLGLSMGSM